ncbi:MAG: hypothetical protein DYG89_06800 [Caldilinea sp. CFX5]|nr:hypothetical protein [Caldilinea sp. CFX5]
MKCLISLDQLKPNNASVVGGKAYNCARLKQAGFPVPDGFAVTTAAMGNADIADELEVALARFPGDVLFAVRSSAVDEDGADHSFAGLHTTKLNVPRTGVLDAIHRCWASVQSPQALAYRQAQGLATQNIQTGVLVQLMVQPTVAGVAFTINPVTGARDELVINATWGLGESLVSGRVEPDEFRLHKPDGALIAAQVGAKHHRIVAEQGEIALQETTAEERTTATLTASQLAELATLLTRIEAEYDAPQDVEWCYDGSQFWIVQSRPVTRVAPVTANIEWTRANLREVFPELPSPQVAHTLCAALESATRYLYDDLLVPAAELGPIAKTIYGRPYFNLSQFRHLCRISGQPMAPSLRGMGHSEPITADDEAIAPRTLGESWQALPTLLRFAGKLFQTKRIIEGQFALVKKTLTALAAQDPHTLPDEALIARVHRASAVLTESAWKAIVLMGSVNLYYRMVDAVCRKVGIAADTLFYTQLAVGEKSVSAQQGFDLLALAHLARNDATVASYFQQCDEGHANYRKALADTAFLRAFDQFLEHYGHRGIYESDASYPRYAEEPTPLLQAIRSHVQAPTCPLPAEIQERQAQAATASWQAFTQAMSPWQRQTLLPRVRWAVARTKQLFHWREQNRSEAMRVMMAARQSQLVLADRFVEQGWLTARADYYLVYQEEIEEAIRNANAGDRLNLLAAKRRAEQNAWRELKLPLFLREAELPTLLRQQQWSVATAGVTRLQGLGVSAGWVEGEVVVIRSPDDFASMKAGAILVTTATDPSWTPLFTLASGVILEIGGIGSHAATVAREYGLPAIANVKNATTLLQDGMRVRLDATLGMVEIQGESV